MKSIVELSRDLIREREGEFLTVLVGNPALYQIPTSATAMTLVDAFADTQPQAFVEAVGTYLLSCVEVA